MLTLKLYADRGFRTRIIECESVTVLKNGSAEITVHGMRHNGELIDDRFDIIDRNGPLPTAEPEIWWERAIIENANGKTSEVIYADSGLR